MSLYKMRNEYTALSTFYSPAADFKAEKLGDPSPVTGSQPVPAEKPLVLHPGFVPLVMSFNAEGLE